jgi:hypothetical protein
VKVVTVVTVVMDGCDSGEDSSASGDCGDNGDDSSASGDGGDSGDSVFQLIDFTKNGSQDR